MLIPLVLVLGGCTNSFVRSYSGETHPEVAHSFALTEAPPHARLIGSSLFVSRGSEGQADALAAAREVGAHYVVWDRVYIGSSEEIDHVAIGTDFRTRWNKKRGTRVTVRTTRYVPVVRVEHWHEYYAEFYRTTSGD